MSSLNCGGGFISLDVLVCLVKFATMVDATYNPASLASLSASVIASLADGGTEKPSASFSGYSRTSVHSRSLDAKFHTSGLASSGGGGDRGSINSGITSWVVPFTAAGAGVGLAALSS